MSLIVNKGISIDGKTIYLIDATLGYGDTLPERNTLAIIPYVVYKKISGDIEIFALAYDPLVDSTFGFNVEELDGVHLGYLFAVPRWTSGVLSEGDVVFDMNDLRLKKYVDDVLVEINTASLVEESSIENGSVYALVTTSITVKRDVLELEKLKKLEEYLEDKCEFNEYIQISRDYDYVRTLRAASFIEFAKALYVVAQQKLETGNSFADTVIARIIQNS
jgi:hypothetical protein